MALWGISANVDEAKPKWLTDEQKKNVYATDRGWVQLNGKGLEEVIVAIGGLAGGTSETAGLGKATADYVNFVNASYSALGGGNLDVLVTFNERVTVTGLPQITITNTTTSATYTAEYVSTYRNRVTFRVTNPTPVAKDDVLTVLGQPIAPNGGAIEDYGTNLASNLNIPEVASTLTVVE